MKPSPETNSSAGITSPRETRLHKRARRIWPEVEPGMEPHTGTRPMSPRAFHAPA
jgi:hypothetical protein